MEETTKPLRQEELTAGTIPDQPVQAKIGPIGRLFGVLLSPTETFADINRKPTWLTAIIIATLLAIGFWVFFNWRVKPNWTAFLAKRIEQRNEKTGVTMSPEEVQAQAERVAGFTKISTYVFPVLGPILAALIVSGLLAVGMMFIQAQTSFKKVLSVYAWSSCGVSVVSLLVNCATLMAKDRAGLDQIDLGNPAGFAATNLGVFLSADASPFLKSLVGSLDIFSLWLIILLSVGLAAVAGSKRITKGKTASIVIGLWVIYVLVKSGFATLGG